MAMMLSPGGCCGNVDTCFIRVDPWTDSGDGTPTDWIVESGSVTFESDGTITLAAGTRLIRSWDWNADPVITIQVVTEPTGSLYLGCDAVTVTETDLRRFGQYARATQTGVSYVHRLVDHPSLTSNIVSPSSYPGFPYGASNLHVMREKTTTWPGYLLFNPSGFVKQWKDGDGTGSFQPDLRSRDGSRSVHAFAPYGYPIDPYETDLHALERWIVNPGAGNSPVGGIYSLLFPPQNQFSANNNQGSQLTHAVLVIETEAEVTIGPVRVEQFCHAVPSWGGGFVEAGESAWSFQADLAFDFEGIYLPRLLPDGTQILADTSSLNLGGTVSWNFGDPSFSFIQYTGEIYEIKQDPVTFEMFWQLSEVSGFPWDQPTDSYVTLSRSQTLSPAGYSGPEWLGSHSVLRFPTLGASQFAGEVVLIWDEASDTTTILVSIGVGTVASFFVATNPQYKYTWGKTVAGPLDETTQSHTLPLIYSYGQYGDTPESSWSIGDLTISW